MRELESGKFLARIRKVVSAVSLVVWVYLTTSMSLPQKSLIFLGREDLESL